MRRARQHMTLALALTPLLLLGSTGAVASGRTVLPSRGVVQERAVVFQPVFGLPCYWDPFWYPCGGFGWGISYAYGPPPYGG